MAEKLLLVANHHDSVAKKHRQKSLWNIFSENKSPLLHKVNL